MPFLWEKQAQIRILPGPNLPAVFANPTKLTGDRGLAAI
jgi:hypothetical protein